MQDWDDLRYFLTVAREGTASGAAKSLSVNYTTVIRRLSHLEEKSGIILFNRQSSGYQLTSEGMGLLQTALGIEEQFADLERQLYGKDTRLIGTIRIDTTDHLAILLMDDFAEFSARNPDVELQIMTNLEAISLSKRDADIAFRFTNAPPEHLLCQHVCDVEANIYSSAGYLKNMEGNTDPSSYNWVGWDENYAGGATARHIENFLPDNISFSCRVNSGISLNSAIISGLGIGYMWRFVAKKYPSLLPVNPQQDYFPMGLWMLLHKDMAGSGRLQAFSAFLCDRIREKFAHEPRNSKH